MNARVVIAVACAALLGAMGFVGCSHSHSPGACFFALACVYLLAALWFTPNAPPQRD